MIQTLRLVTCLVIGLSSLACADESPSRNSPPPTLVAPHEHKPEKLPADLSGHKRLGKASFYAKKFAGQKMADGARMQPQGDNAASKTLPLGTTAR